MVAVRDNGIGFDPSQQDTSHSHVGLANVRTRLAEMCGASLTIDSTPGVGTTVTIALPERKE